MLSHRRLMVGKKRPKTSHASCAKLGCDGPLPSSRSTRADVQMPFINLAVVPEFGSSWSVPARIGHVRAAGLILLGAPFDARRAAELGLVSEVVSDKDVLARATETARKLAAKPAAALQASKRLMKQPFREQIKAAMKAENEEFSTQVRSEDAKEAFAAFLQKRKPDFTKSIKSPATA